MSNTAALVFGVIYAIAGLVGFILAPGGGVLLGIFPVNAFHNIFHLATGGLGIASGWTGRGRSYCRAAGIVFLLLGVSGFLAPPLTAALLAHPTADIFTDNLLHLATGIVLSYFGFVPRPAPLHLYEETGKPAG